MNAVIKRDELPARTALLALHGDRGKGVYAIIDEYLRPTLGTHRWYLSTNGYVVLCRPFCGEIYLHRLILGAGPGDICDHINGNRFDNREDNLRFVSKANNNRNTSKRRHSKQPYKGVKATPEGRWKARIRHNKREIHLGHYDTPEEAAQAYNLAAEQLFGEFARKVQL